MPSMTYHRNRAIETSVHTEVDTIVRSLAKLHIEWGGMRFEDNCWFVGVGIAPSLVESGIGGLQEPEAKSDPNPTWTCV